VLPDDLGADPAHGRLAKAKFGVYAHRGTGVRVRAPPHRDVAVPFDLLDKRLGRRTDGLTVRLDNDRAAEVLLPDAFVAGARKDGAPNLSHAWARTVDGAQGGTWEACHLLGSSALDAYRGYTGQSRSRRPTHTWNTARVAVVDHGGALADQGVFYR
jgi:hypothetical protein